MDRSNPDKAIILVVDDDPGIVRLVERAITRSGHRVATARTAAEAAAWLSRNQADLLLLDLKLPDASNGDLVSRLQRKQPVPFLVFTGQGDERVAVEMMKRGASDYLVKDAQFIDILPAVVDRALSRIEMSKRLASAEEQVRLVQTAIEQARDGILITDASGAAPRIVYANPAFGDVLGVTGDPLLGKTIAFLDKRFSTSCFHHALRGKAPYAGETVVSNGNCGRRRRTLECQIAPVKNDKGQITHWVSIHRDITERKEAEKALQSRVRQQAAVADLGKKVVAGATVEAVLRDAAEILVDTLDVDFSKVLEMTAGGERFILRAGAGWCPGYVGAATVAREQTSAGLAIDTLQPVICGDLATDSRFPIPALLRDHGVAATMTVPIYDRGGCYGVLGVGAKSPRAFNRDDLHFLQSIANAISGALERRHAENEILEASAREQQRIGQDLHDGLGQQLAGIELMSHILAEELAEVAPEQAERAGSIAGRIREAIVHTRMLARGLSPVELEAEGLMKALKELTADAEALFGARCKFVCRKPVLVKNNSRATHLYRIAQEAIHNAIKHGKAGRVTVSLTNIRGQRALRIEDNGRGFPPDSPPPAGMGMRIMNHRAAMSGASLEIRSLNGNKTGVRVTCILEERPDARIQKKDIDRRRPPDDARRPRRAHLTRAGSRSLRRSGRRKPGN